MWNISHYQSNLFSSASLKVSNFLSDIIIQVNSNGKGSVFNKNWNDYKNGFGSVEDKAYWIGLDRIHDLTKSGAYGLKMILKKNGSTKVVRWSSFVVGNEAGDYRLSVSGFNAGSSGLSDRLAYHNNMRFSTKDRDNDPHPGHCASYYGNVGWWYVYGCWYCLPNYGTHPPSYQGSRDEIQMILER